jgi:hypothetical protein
MPTNTEMPSPIAETSRIPAICARIVGTSVLASSLFLFLLGTPLGALGVWFQTEPVTAGLLATGAAAGLSVLLLDLIGHSIGILLARRMSNFCSYSSPGTFGSRPSKASRAGPGSAPRKSAKAY